MPVRRRLAALAAAALLAAPAPALAQSAGDEQYEDPFGGEQQEQPQQEATPAPTATPAPETPTAPEPTGQTEQEPVGELTPAPDAAATASAQQELPRTGFDAAWLVAGGAVLLAGGLVLRLRLRERA